MTENHDLVLRVRIFLGFCVMYVFQPGYRVAMWLIHGYWFTTGEMWEAMARLCLAHDYGGRDNAEMVLAFAKYLEDAKS